MPTTPTYGFPYPGAADDANGPADLQLLAQAVEDRIEILDAESVFPAIVTTLPGSPTTGQQVILTDSLANPTYQWLCQYDAAAGGGPGYRWRVLGPMPLRVSATALNHVAAAWSTFLSIAAPRTGLYRVFAEASAIPVQGQSEVIRVLAGGGEQSRNSTFTFGTAHVRHEHAAVIALSSGQLIEWQQQSNGSDGQHAIGSIELVPVRFS